MARLKIPRICTHCGTGYEVFISEEKRTRFCSRKCLYDSQRRPTLVETDKERLFSRTTQSGECLLWTGGTNRTGRHAYGLLSARGHIIKAHRLSYEIRHGVRLTPQQKVLHKCDNPLCVNPDHLFIGTQLDNMRDCVAKGRHAHGETTYSKLTEEQVRLIRCDPRSQGQIAKDYGVKQTTIWAIKHRKLWKHVE